MTGEDTHRGERVIMRAVFDLDNAAKIQSSHSWMMAIFSLALLPLAPLIWLLISPCGIGERVRAPLLWPALRARLGAPEGKRYRTGRDVRLLCVW